MITIYGKDDCSYCARAVQLCESRNLPYTYLKLGRDYTLEEFIEKFPGRKKVPQVIANNVLLDDGYTSLVEWCDGGYGEQSL